MLVLANEMFDSPPVFAWVLPVFLRLKPGKEETFSPRHSHVFLVFFYVVDVEVCVCVLLLQDLLQSCARGGRRRVEDMCYERRRAEACVDESAHHALGVLCTINSVCVGCLFLRSPSRVPYRTELLPVTKF